MKIKRAILMLTAISLLVTITTFGKGQGSLAAPTISSIIETTATIDGIPGVDVVKIDWNDITGAVKYSVDIEGVVTYNTGGDDLELEVEFSFGTSDRLDGYEMGQSDLNIPVLDIAAAVEAALLDAGVDLGTLTADVVLVSTAKVKALGPGNGNGRQNNPFSPPVAMPTLSGPLPLP